MDPETRAHNLSCGEQKQQDTHNMTETQEKESWVVCPCADTPRRAMEALDGGRLEHTGGPEEVEVMKGTCQGHSIVSHIEGEFTGLSPRLLDRCDPVDLIVCTHQHCDSDLAPSGCIRDAYACCNKCTLLHNMAFKRGRLKTTLKVGQLQSSKHRHVSPNSSETSGDMCHLTAVAHLEKYRARLL